MSELALLRSRDASATVRGFVYQIDLTIERWLSLTPGDTLELERGEDIDIISRHWPSGSDVHRILEQVKSRTSSVTLRSEESLSAIAGFAEHRAANPGLRLLFRFVTNTKAARERPSPLPGRYSGIAAWEEVRQNRAQDPAILVEGIRGLLAAARRPKKLSVATWAHFEALARASAPNLTDFIRMFEWTMNAPSNDALPALIRSQLLAQTSNHQVADFMYLRLFDHVTRLLCQPGQKQLTIEGLNAILTAPTPELTEQVRLDRIKEALADVRRIVEEHESQLAQMRTQMQGFEGQVRMLLEADHGLLAAEPLPDLSIPTGLVHSASRNIAAPILAGITRATVWTALWGGPGTGKTELARQVALAYPSNPPWIRLRDLDPTQAVARLRRAAIRLGADLRDSNHQTWWRDVASRLGSNRLVVLDDLPRIERGDELFEELLHLATSFEATGARLLTTSVFDPSALRERLPEHLLLTVRSPSFTDSEIGAWLTSLGAPPSWLEPISIRYLALQTGRHPVLLANALARLVGFKWPAVSDFARLIGTERSPDLATMRRLAQSVPDDHRRGLLYRLTLVIGTITIDEVRTVAAVAPPIDEVQQHLAGLEGLWVQADAPGRYVVSPLVKSLGETELAPNVQKLVNFALGDLLSSRKSLGVTDVVAAVQYFTAGEHPARAAALLSWALHSARLAKDRRAAKRLLRIWSVGPLPDLPVPISLHLRAMQISTATWANAQMADAEADLTDLINQTPPNDSWALVSAAVVLMTTRGLKSPIAVRVFKAALPRLQGATLPDGRPLSSLMPAAFEHLIWLFAADFESHSEIEQWLDALRAMTPDQIAVARQSDMYPEACTSVVDRVWLLEAGKPPSEQDWERVTALLDQMGALAATLGLEALWSWSLRVRIIATAEYLHRVDEGIALGIEGLQRASEDPFVQFALLDIIGAEQILAGDHASARLTLAQANALSFDGLVFFKIRSLSYFSSIEETPADAVALLERAIKLATETPHIPESLTTKVLAELALAQWLAGGVKSAFDRWDETAQRIVESQTTEMSDDAKAIFVLFGHASGYLASLASRGIAPATTAEGGAYAAPNRGGFLTISKGLSRMYSDSRRPQLFTIMALFAEGVGRDDRAAEWALQGIDAAAAAEDDASVSVLAGIGVNYLIVADRYAEALDVALQGAKATLKGLNKLRESAEPPAWTSRTGPIQNGTRRAEEHVVGTALFAMSLRLAHLSVDGRPDIGARAASVCAACDVMAKSSVAPEMWIECKQLFEKIFLEQLGREALHEESIRLGERFGVELRVIAYVGASTSPDASLTDAVQLHREALRFVSGTTGARSSTLRLLLNPLIVTFWTRALSEQRFNFRTPSLVEENLKDAMSRATEEQPMAILRAAADGLGVRLSA